MFRVLIVFIIALSIVFTSCTQSVNNEIEERDVFENGIQENLENAGTLGKTLGADACGAYAGFKTGGWLGLIAGPLGAKFGAVVGTAIGGSYASYEMGKRLSEEGVIKPGPLSDGDTPYDNDNLDSLGSIHNDILLLTWENPLFTGDTDLDRQIFYTIATNYLSNRGWDSVTVYFPYSGFENICSDLEGISDLDGIDTLLTNFEYSTVSSTHLSNMIHDISQIQNFNLGLQNIQTYYNNVDSLSLTNDEEISALKNSIRIAEYSYALWRNNLVTLFD